MSRKSLRKSLSKRSSRRTTNELMQGVKRAVNEIQDSSTDISNRKLGEIRRMIEMTIEKVKAQIARALNTMVIERRASRRSGRRRSTRRINY